MIVMHDKKEFVQFVNLFKCLKTRPNPKIAAEHPNIFQIFKKVYE